MTLKYQILAAAAFDSLKDYSYDSENDITYHYHIRMLPLLTALAEVCGAAEIVLASKRRNTDWTTQGYCDLEKQLEVLRKLVGEK